MASLSTAATTVIQVSIAADANNGQTKGLVKAVVTADSDIT